MRDISKIVANKIEINDSEINPNRLEGERYEAYMTILDAKGMFGRQFFIPNEISIGR